MSILIIIMEQITPVSEVVYFARSILICIGVLITVLIYFIHKFLLWKDPKQQASSYMSQTKDNIVSTKSNTTKEEKTNWEDERKKWKSKYQKLEKSYIKL